jgi:hexosaminidase
MKRILFFCLILAACKPSVEETVFQAQDLKVTWKSISNDGGSFKCNWTLENSGNQTLGDEGWALYYNQIAGVPDASTLPQSVLVEQISGTFYRISPQPGFELAPAASMQFGYTAYGAAIKTSDAPSGLYMTIEDQQPQAITQYTVEPFVEPQQINRGSTDLVPIPTTEKRYELNQYLSEVEADELPDLVPTPASLMVSPESFELSESLSISHTDGLESVAQMLAGKLTTSGRSIEIKANQESADIVLSMRNSGFPEEGYSLISSNNGITISGGSAAGTFYGTQTLLQILPEEFWEGSSGVELAGYKITDQPRFTYRGLHLDVSRNFHSTESVKKLMDLMGFYKLNKFHFHLTDDEGWRLAIKGLEELTEVGGRRGHTEDELDHLRPAYGSGPDVNSDDNYGNGHYSREEFIEILQYLNNWRNNFPHILVCCSPPWALFTQQVWSKSNGQFWTCH